MDKDKLFQKYLHGLLSDEEENELAQLIESDSELAAELEIEASIYTLRNKKLKEEISSKKRAGTAEINQSSKEKVKSKPVIRLLRPILIAASIILPFIYFGSQFLNPSSSETDLLSLYMSEVFEAPATLMNEANDSQETGNEAMKLYRSENFSASAEILENIKERSELQELYLGLSHLFKSQRDLDLSLNSLDKVLHKQGGKYRDIAIWYVAIIYHEKGMKGKSNQLLTEIVESKSWNHRKAQKLIEAR